jgi:hypothetical protein
MLCARMITLPFIIFELLPFVTFHSFCPELIEVSTWNFIDGYISLRVQHTIIRKIPCTIFQLLPFVIFSHQYSHRFQICNHFSHQFSLPIWAKDFLELNYSALLHIHSSNEQTHPAGDGHVNMALVTINTGFVFIEWYENKYFMSGRSISRSKTIKWSKH